MGFKGKKPFGGPPPPFNGKSHEPEPFPYIDSDHDETQPFHQLSQRKTR